MNELAPALEQEEWRCWESGEWQHLPYVVLRDLTRQQLDATDVEIAQAHLDICPECRKEAADLVALHQSLQRAVPAPLRQAARSWLWMPLLGSGIGAAATLLLLVPRVFQNAHEQTVQQTRLARIEATLAEREKPVVATPVPVPTAIPKLSVTSTPRPPQPTPDPAMAQLKKQVAQLEARLSALATVPTSNRTIRDSPTPKRLVQQVALALPDLSALSLSELRGSTNESHGFALVAPVGRVILEVRPNLKWSACSGAVRYRWHVSRLEDITSISEGESDSLVGIPDRDLPQGIPLAWEVHAFDSEDHELGLAAQARFQIATEQQIRRIEKAIDPIERARALAEAGLLSEARDVVVAMPDSRIKRDFQRALKEK